MNSPSTPPESKLAYARRQFARIAPYFAGTRMAMLLVVLMITIGALTEPLIPALMKPLLDKGFAQKDLHLWLVPAAIIGVFFVRGVASFIAQYGIAHVANVAMQAMRKKLFAKMQVVAPQALAQTNSSAMVNTIVYEIQSGTTMLVNTLLTLAKDSLTLLALLAYLFYLNAQLTLVVFVMFPIVGWLMSYFSKRLHHATKLTQDSTEQLAYTVEENMLAWRAVRLHQAQQQQESRFARVSEALRRITMKGVVSNSIMTPLTQMVAALALSAVITIALWQSQQTGATVGSFVAFTTAMLMLIAPIKHLSDVAGPVTRGLAAIERGLNLLENTPEEVGGTHTSARARGEIVLEHVALRYNAATAPALADIALHIQAGETLALVGSSGAGKSTLMNLLPRFLEPTGGRITLDGVPLPDWDLANLRAQFALVSQDVVLFNDSVAANVALGAESMQADGSTRIDEARVQAALQAANLASFVATLPQGMQSSVGHNGSQLSGGQRQRLAIARALYKDAPILLLDEATSALDTESEKLVQDALKTLMQGRTTLIIAHRLSTIEHADRIVVLEHGRIVEMGQHAQLLARGGAYARLHQHGFSAAAQTESVS